MKISVRQSGRVTILDVEGRLTVEATREISLADCVREVLRQGGRHVLINLEHVASIDSTGVRDIVESYVTSTRQGAELKLLSLPAKVRSVLTITRLLSILEAYDAEPAAMASFGSSR